MRSLLARAVAAFQALAPRERLLVGSAAALLVVALLYVAIVNPILSAADLAEQRLLTADQQLRVMERLRREYDEVQHRLADVERRIRSGTRGNLRTTLESLAGQSQVKVESMEPQPSPANDAYRETKVELGLKGVTLTQTVQYLHQIESAPQVLSVKSLRIHTRADKPELLDVTFTVSSFEPL